MKAEMVISATESCASADQMLKLFRQNNYSFDSPWAIENQDVAGPPPTKKKHVVVNKESGTADRTWLQKVQENRKQRTEKGLTRITGEVGLSEVSHFLSEAISVSLQKTSSQAMTVKHALTRPWQQVRLSGMPSPKAHEGLKK